MPTIFLWENLIAFNEGFDLKYCLGTFGTSKHIHPQPFPETGLIGVSVSVVRETNHSVLLLLCLGIEQDCLEEQEVDAKIIIVLIHVFE